MTLIHSESLKDRESRARRNIGRHLLVGLGCKDGFIFAKRRSQRDRVQDSYPPWFNFFDDRVFSVTIGDFGDTKEFQTGLHSENEYLGDWLGDRYVTSFFTSQAGRMLMKQKYQKDVNLFGLSAVVGSLENTSLFYLISFTGKVRKFPNFVVTGAALQTDECREAKQGAINFLSNEWGDYQSGHYVVDGSVAKPLVSEALNKFDPPSDDDVLDFILINENGFLLAQE